MKIALRPLQKDEIPSALALVWKVFSEYEAPVYGKAGTDEFYRAIHDEVYLDGIAYFGAFDGGELIGVVGIRPERCHICFFFVQGDYHRQGIGTKLFRFMTEQISSSSITVNSSPFGLPFYLHLGFFAIDDEQTANGIRFTPMRYIRACETLTPQRFSFRRAKPSDKAAVANLYDSVKDGEFCVWNEYYPTDTEIEYDTKDGNLYLLFLGEKLVSAGTIAAENEYDGLPCWRYGTEIGEIARVAVSPDMKGMGLGVEIVSILEEFLRLAGKKAVHLLVAKKNISAIKTYQKCGYVFIGECFMYGNDYFACEKNLTKEFVYDKKETVRNE